MHPSTIISILALFVVVTESASVPCQEGSNCIQVAQSQPTPSTVFFPPDANPSQYVNNFHPDCNEYYYAKSTDSNWAVASKHGLTWNEYAKLNPVPLSGSYDLVYPGMKVCISRYAGIPPSNPDGTYKKQTVVGQYETCDTYSDKISINSSVFKTLNPSINCNSPLVRGSTVVVSRGLHPDCKSRHVINENEHSHQIAKDNGLQLSDLEALNPGLSLTTIYVGNTLCVSLDTSRKSKPSFTHQ